jgi:hypothetical protein
LVPWDGSIHQNTLCWGILDSGSCDIQARGGSGLRAASAKNEKREKRGHNVIRTFYEYFNTAAFARPALGTLGNASSVVARGINNWNISLFKNISLRERLDIQFRAEAYNVFNHPQFSNVNTTPKFDAAGNQVNKQFGQVTAARDPRIMQFALRLRFRATSSTVRLCRPVLSPRRLRTRRRCLQYLRATGRQL